MGGTMPDATAGAMVDGMDGGMDGAIVTVRAGATAGAAAAAGAAGAAAARGALGRDAAPAPPGTPAMLMLVLIAGAGAAPCRHRGIRGPIRFLRLIRTSGLGAAAAGGTLLQFPESLLPRTWLSAAVGASKVNLIGSGPARARSSAASALSSRCRAMVAPRVDAATCSRRYCSSFSLRSGAPKPRPRPARRLLRRPLLHLRGGLLPRRRHPSMEGLREPIAPRRAICASKSRSASERRRISSSIWISSSRSRSRPRFACSMHMDL